MQNVACMSCTVSIRLLESFHGAQNPLLVICQIYKFGFMKVSLTSKGLKTRKPNGFYCLNNHNFMSGSGNLKHLKISNKGEKTTGVEFLLARRTDRSAQLRSPTRSEQILPNPFSLLVSGSP